MSDTLELPQSPFPKINNTFPPTETPAAPPPPKKKNEKKKLHKRVMFPYDLSFQIFISHINQTSHCSCERREQ